MTLFQNAICRDKGRVKNGPDVGMELCCLQSCPLSSQWSEPIPLNFMAPDLEERQIESPCGTTRTLPYRNGRLVQYETYPIVFEEHLRQSA